MAKEHIFTERALRSSRTLPELLEQMSPHDMGRIVELDYLFGIRGGAERQSDCRHPTRSPRTPRSVTGRWVVTNPHGPFGVSARRNATPHYPFINPIHRATDGQPPRIQCIRRCAHHRRTYGLHHRTRIIHHRCWTTSMDTTTLPYGSPKVMSPPCRQEVQVPVAEDDNAMRPQFMPQAQSKPSPTTSVFVFKNGNQWATDDQRNDYVVAFRSTAGCTGLPRRMYWVRTLFCQKRPHKHSLRKWQRQSCPRIYSQSIFAGYRPGLETPPYWTITHQHGCRQP